MYVVAVSLVGGQCGGFVSKFVYGSSYCLVQELISATASLCQMGVGKWKTHEY